MILTHSDFKCQDLRTSDPEDYNLALGQAWEEILAAALRTKGLKAYRPKQQFMSPQRGVKVSKLRLRGKHELADQRAKEWHDKAKLRPFQLELIVKLGRRLNVEVKALQPNAFKQHDVHFGLCDKYDRKWVKLDAIVLFN